MKVTTAIIWAAGYGTRMLPVTAGVSKVMLPLLDRPVIDYVVADCVAAGVTRIILVVSPDSRDIKDFFIGNRSLEAHLRKFNKSAALDRLHSIHNQAEFVFVEQPEDAGYGTAIPVKLAAKHLKPDEAFLVSEGDSIFWRADGGSDMADLVKAFEASDADGALLTQERPDQELHRYGILDVETRSDGKFLKRLIEKPSPGTAPSNLVNVSRYILTPKIMPFILNPVADPKSGEYLFTDVIQSAAAKNRILAQTAEGKWLDSGNLASWLEANITLAATRPDLTGIVATLVPR